MSPLTRVPVRSIVMRLLLPLWVWLLPAFAAAQGTSPAPAPAAASPGGGLAAKAPGAAGTTRTELDFAAAGSRSQWNLGGKGYDVGIDTRETRAGGGPQSLRLALRPGVPAAENAFGVASYRFPVEQARGKHLRFEGWIKSAAIGRGWAGLWTRIDGRAGVLAFDNMADRGVRGTTAWSRFEIDLDVPPEASAIFLGALLSGDGTAWVSDLAVSIEPMRPAVPVAVGGTVQDASGRPVAGALVALVAAGASHAAAVVRTDAHGAFRTSVGAGKYALTATAPGLAAAFEPAMALSEPSLHQITLKLGAGCVRLIGTLAAAGGGPPAGTHIGAGRYSDQEGDIFYAELDGAGTFSLCLAAGRYAIAPETADFIFKPAVVELAAGGPDQRVTLAGTRLGPAPEEVVSWLRGHVVPLRGTTAGEGFDDLRPLASIVGKARIVALGEATHGSREFFQLKHRLLEYLVSELGFTVFAIEANWPESLAVDDFVQHGTGDPAKALAGLYFWTWNTEEVLDMIRWMRAYDADPAHPRKVRFLGFDMQTAKVAAAVVAAYLEKVDPAYAKERESDLVEWRRDRRAQTPAAGTGAPAAARAMVAEFDSRQGAWIAASSRQEWDLARQHAVIVAQALELAAGKGPELRDQDMADNAAWILAHEPAGTRMVVWAHNGHVNYAAGAGYSPMGEHLRRAFGADYLSIGFVFNQGAFQAIGKTAHGGGLQEFSLGPSPDGDLAAAFSRTGIPLALLDLRARPAAGPVAAWLTAPHPMRETGALFTTEENMTETTVITDRFDALLFVDRTTRARPNPAIRSEKAQAGSGFR